MAYIIVQLSKSEELPFKCSRQLHFPKCLPFSPCKACSWVSEWEWEVPVQYSGKCACLKTIPTMGAQYIQCFPILARPCCKSSKNKKDKFHPMLSLDACTSLWALAMYQHFPLKGTSPTDDMPITTDRSLLLSSSFNRQWIASLKQYNNNLKKPNQPKRQFLTDNS